jgi:hypothetical protein
MSIYKSPASSANDHFDPDDVIEPPITYGRFGPQGNKGVKVLCVNDQEQTGHTFNFKVNVTVGSVAEYLRAHHQKARGSVELRLFTSRWKRLSPEHVLASTTPMVIMYEIHENETVAHYDITFEVQVNFNSGAEREVEIDGCSRTTFGDILKATASKTGIRTDYMQLVVDGKDRTNLDWERPKSEVVVFRVM